MSLMFVFFCWEGFIIIFLQFVVETEQTSNFTFKTTYHKRLSMLANKFVEHDEHLISTFSVF